MSRRNTISVDCVFITDRLAETGRTKAAFSRLLGKYRQWWVNVEQGNNLPSPEEAARMCDILGVQPEDFITEEADIAKVRAIIGTQKQTPIETDGRSERFMRLYCNLTDDQKDALVNLMEKMTGEK